MNQHSVEIIARQVLKPAKNTFVRVREIVEGQKTVALIADAFTTDNDSSNASAAEHVDGESAEVRYSAGVVGALDALMDKLIARMPGPTAPAPMGDPAPAVEAPIDMGEKVGDFEPPAMGDEDLPPPTEGNDTEPPPAA